LEIMAKRKKRPAAREKADPLLLHDDTPYIEGHYADGTPFRMMKPADASPAPQPPQPTTIAELRRRIEFFRTHWNEGGDRLYSIFSGGDIAELWNAARAIPGAPPPPDMPAPFVNGQQSTYVQQGHAALDILLRWCDEVEAGLATGDDAVTTPAEKGAVRSGRVASGKAPAATLRKLPTRPPGKAFQAWQIREGLSISNQAEIARIMVKQGVKASQGQVSKWLAAVESWRTAGGVMPKVGTFGGEPQSVDPAILDMGGRQDGLTKRQRPRRDPDADE
jgi:hypothetical protein